MNSSSSKVAFFKSTYRVLFALGLIASITLSVRVIIPAVVGIPWRGTADEQVFFIAYVWLLSSALIGVMFICGSLLALARIVGTLRNREGANPIPEKSDIVASYVRHPFPRWAISIAPAFGPPLAMAFVTQFYRTQFFFPDSQKLLLATSLLGLVSFVICLPLTIWSQKTLHDRFAENYPEAVPPSDE